MDTRKEIEDIVKWMKNLNIKRINIWDNELTISYEIVDRTMKIYDTDSIIYYDSQIVNKRKFTNTIKKLKRFKKSVEKIIEYADVLLGHMYIERLNLIKRGFETTFIYLQDTNNTIIYLDKTRLGYVLSFDPNLDFRKLEDLVSKLIMK